METLSTESQAMGQAMYESAAQDAQGAEGAGADTGAEDVVDAEVVDEPNDKDTK